MSSPMNALKDSANRVPFGGRSRPVPFRAKPSLDLGPPKSKSRAGGRRGRASPPGGGVQDIDLMATMMQRLSQVESLLRAAQAEGEIKDKTISKQREKILALELAAHGEKDSDSVVAALTAKCNKLQRNLHSVETFLADYGMVWIGDDEEGDDVMDDGRAGAAAGAAAAQAAAAPLTAPSGDRMWTPAVAVHGEQSEKQHFPDGSTPVNFDKIISNIAELNDLAGEGIGKVEKDRHGAQRIVMPDPINIRFYQNGILMFEGPFRPYDDAETKSIIGDFTDGYFPSELQARYPDGIPFKVFDLRAEEYQKGDGLAGFGGNGRVLGGAARPSKLLAGGSGASSNIHTARDTEGGAVPTVSAESFLNRLPKQVIRGGRVIDIRSGIAGQVSTGGSTGQVKVAVVETPVVTEMKQRLDEQGTAQEVIERPVTPSDTATIQVKLPGQKLILKLRFNDTVGQLRACIDKHMSAGPGGKIAYKLHNSYPRKQLTDNAASLLDQGLTPSATIHLIPLK